MREQLIAEALANSPIPRDIPLPMPGDPTFFKVLLVVSFLTHILFVNLMVGGSLLTMIFEMMGIKDKRFDHLAHEIAKTVTVNKSVAVVLGVAPLLLINVLYTVYFYSANSLTGYAWASIIPLVAVAFLLLYWHKYSWETMEKPKHILVGMGALAIFMFIPLVFLSNINLMLHPERWTSQAGFLSVVTSDINIWARYLHFLMGSLAVTGLFVAYWFGRASFPAEERTPGFERPQMRRLGYQLAYGATIANFVIGPTVLISLSVRGISVGMLVVIFLGVLPAMLAVHFMKEELNGPDALLGRRLVPVVGLLTLTVVMMGGGRHMYRETITEPHRKLVAAKTQAWVEKVETAQARLAQKDQEVLASVAKMPHALGKEAFTTSCSACHASGMKLVGPSVEEITEIYANDKTGLISWIENPGKKREGMPQMPSFAHLGDEKLEAIAGYLLSTARQE